MEEAINKITEVTRRNIQDRLSLVRIPYHGRLDEPTFWSRLINLKALPSHDGRYSNFFQDMHKHQVQNNDWPDGWYFTDPRIDLQDCPDDLFLRFACETIHPIVRQDPEEVQTLLDLFNKELQRDGFELYPFSEISGHPVYTTRLILQGSPPSLAVAEEAFSAWNAGQVSSQITRLYDSVSKDPALAIGTAKEFLEMCCKTILKMKAVPISGSPDFPALVRETVKSLNLKAALGEGYSPETVRRFLSGLTTLVNGIMELRNAAGTGHGRDAFASLPPVAMGRLAVGSAATVATFFNDILNAEAAAVAEEEKPTGSLTIRIPKKAR